MTIQEYQKTIHRNSLPGGMGGAIGHLWIFHMRWVGKAFARYREWRATQKLQAVRDVKGG